MENNKDKDLVNYTSTDASSNANAYDELARSWLNLCMIGVSSAHAATTTWLQLSCAAIGLHTSHVQCTPSDREGVRRALLHYITQSDKRCRDMLCLSSFEFASLVSILKSKGRVKNYYRGSVEEQLVIFLQILGHQFKNRVVSVLLCRSGETISRYFHNILESVIMLEEDYVKQPSGQEVPPTIFNSHRFFPFFKDCLGALDGTHVRVKVSPFNAPRYRGRKDWPTQNVVAVCTFDLKFTYILAGWEGSAADSRVLHSALTRDEPLVIPYGKFYLGDAGFGLTSKVLTPYGRTRYHLKEFSQKGPETAEELFNHCHSSLRNAIERAFGVLKKRFPIIASGSECHFSSSTMTDIVLACAVLHNFILCEGNVAEGVLTAAEQEVDPEISVDYHGDSNVYNGTDGSDEYLRGLSLRASIASEMWAAYCMQRQGSTLPECLT